MGIFEADIIKNDATFLDAGNVFYKNNTGAKCFKKAKSTY